MPRQKYTHNTKSLRRYKVKELRSFIKENQIPIKRTSKLTKTEIISNLIRLQRNCGKTNKCMKMNLKIKDKKKLTPLQEQALLKGQNAMKERRLRMKQKVKPSQKIDKKPIKVPEKLPVPEPTNEIKQEIKLEEEKPSQLLLIKSEGITERQEENFNLDDLFEKADMNIQKNKEYFEDIFGLLEEKKNEDDERIKFQKKMMKKKGEELKRILRENNISSKGRQRKEDLIDIIYDNRDKIDDMWFEESF